MKSCAVIVVYNHIPNNTTLESIIKNVDYLIIVDNNSELKTRRQLEIFSNVHSNKVILQINNTNLGVSRAYNIAVKISIKLGVYWLYFFDHDALLFDEYFLQVNQAWEKLKNERIGVVVPIVADSISVVKRYSTSGKLYSMIKTAITSGIMTNIDIFNHVGGFDEDFFVEGADYAFLDRVVSAGYIILRINRVLILQEFESKLNERRLVTMFFDRLISIRSTIRLSIGNSNNFRGTLSVYNNTRSKELKLSYRKLYLKNKKNLVFLLIASLMSYLEKAFIKIIEPG